MKLQKYLKLLKNTNKKQFENPKIFNYLNSKENEDKFKHGKKNYTAGKRAWFTYL